MIKQILLALNCFKESQKTNSIEKRILHLLVASNLIKYLERMHVNNQSISAEHLYRLRSQSNDWQGLSLPSILSNFFKTITNHINTYFSILPQNHQPNLQNNDGKTFLMCILDLEDYHYASKYLSMFHIDKALTDHNNRTALSIVRNQGLHTVGTLFSKQLIKQLQPEVVFRPPLAPIDDNSPRKRRKLNSNLPLEVARTN